MIVIRGNFITVFQRCVRPAKRLNANTFLSCVHTYQPNIYICLIKIQHYMCCYILVLNCFQVSYTFMRSMILGHIYYCLRKFKEFGCLIFRGSQHFKFASRCQVYEIFRLALVDFLLHFPYPNVFGACKVVSCRFLLMITLTSTQK